MTGRNKAVLKVFHELLVSLSRVLRHAADVIGALRKSVYIADK